MIHAITANQPSFRPVPLKPGLNVILAERKDSSGKKDTRNSLGKSTLIQIINFCFGSSATGNPLCVEALQEWEFTLDVTLFGSRIEATRSVANSGVIWIRGDTSTWKWQPKPDPDHAKYFFTLEEWKQVLGLSLFAIEETGFGLSVRALLSYFIRSRSELGEDPLKYFPSQPVGSVRVHNAFLMGLNWQLAGKWWDLQKQEEMLDALPDAIKLGLHESKGELEAEKVQFEAELKRSRDILRSFLVHDQYKDIQVSANNLTSQMHLMANANVSDGRKLRMYEVAIEDEAPPQEGHLEALYEEVGLVFPDAIKKNLENAKVFHRQVVKNRKKFLTAEVTRIEARIQSREAKIERLTQERSALVEILDTHGALEERDRLQELHVQIKEKLEAVKNKISDINKRGKKKKDIKKEKEELERGAEIHYEEARALWEEAVRIYAENSRALYKTPGQLRIDINENGYNFNVTLPGDKGGGVSKMKTFCYDLMLIQMQKKLDRAINFLVHDSLVYEVTDPRQRALALELAATKSEKFGFQYICTLNSDTVPNADFSNGFDFDKYIRLRLTDGDPSGSLLGIRF